MEAVHLVAIITGLARRKEGTGAGQIQLGVGDWLRRGLSVLGTGSRRRGGCIISRLAPAPLQLLLLTLGFFFDPFFSFISDLFVHLPTPAPDGLR